MDWLPITSAPFGFDLEIRMMESGELSALTFPCRRIGDRWYSADTHERVQADPIHWRYWLAAKGTKRSDGVTGKPSPI